MFKKIAFLLGLLVCAPCYAQNVGVIDAEKVERIGVFDDWTAYIYKEQKEKVCFVASMPTKSTGEYTRRGGVFLIISHRPFEDIWDVVTVVAGYTYLPRSEALLRVGDVKASLFTAHDTAWARNVSTDEAVAKAMNLSKIATLRGKNIEGIETYDTFSLKGFNNAMEAINRLCRQP